MMQPGKGMMTGSEVHVRIKRVSDLADVPEYQSSRASGLDLHAAVASAVRLEAGAIALIPCGFVMALPEGYEAQVRPRSGLAVKHGISVPNAPGTIDADYRGEVKVALVNLGRDAFTVEPNMRIAQMVIARVARCEVEVVEELDETVRGAGGFGSTG